MNESCDKLHRTLGRATAGLLIVMLVFYGVAMASALVGFQRIAESLSEAGLVSAFILACLFVALLVSSLVAAIGRWIDPRDRPAA